MTTVSREDALTWAIDNFSNWPSINDWINSKLSAPQGWSFISRPGCYLLILSANGQYSICISDWMKAKGIEIPTRQEALSWVDKHLAEWPVSENTVAPIGWDWVRLVNPNSVTLRANGRISIQKSDWEQKKSDLVTDPKIN